MHRRIATDELPDERVVAEFVHTEPIRTTIWLVLSRQDVSVCTHHPGGDPDVVVRGPTPVLAGVFNGLDDWRVEIANGTIELIGPPRLTRALPSWFLGSPFATDVRAAG